MKLSTYQKSALQQLPSLEQILSSDEFVDLLTKFDRRLIVLILRQVVNEVRQKILNNETNLPELNEYVIWVTQKIQSELSSSIQTVVNCTGTITHTNLGRSLLPAEAIENLQRVASHYVDLEYDLVTGKRGHRDRITGNLLQQLTECQDSTVVNNNAAAVLLVLTTLAAGKEVIISRGELVEIGGSFRIPEVMSESGAILREVGTTNRTHLIDYQEAINENTGLLLKVHPSNYAVVGFQSVPPVEDLAELGHEYQIPVFEDLGSGSLIDLTDFGLPAEPVVKDRLAKGVDILTFSGDKLLGGPQAGLIIGKKDLITRVRQHSLMRALRVDKLTLSALEATLRQYLNPKDLLNRLPMLWRYTRSISELRILADHLSNRLSVILADHAKIEVVKSSAQIGSGSLPIDQLSSIAVAIHSKQFSTTRIAKLFRLSGIIGRIRDDQLWLDVRSVTEVELSTILNAAKEVVKQLDGNNNASNVS